VLMLTGAMLVANEDINRQAREDGISMFVAQGLGEPITFDPLAEDFDSPEIKKHLLKDKNRLN